MKILKTYETINDIIGPKIVIKTNINDFQDDHCTVLEILEDFEQEFTIYRKFIFDDKTYDMIIDHCKDFGVISKTEQYKNLIVLFYIIPDKNNFDEMYGCFFHSKLKETI